MKVTVENKKGLNKDLKIFIDKKTINSYMDEKYEEIKGTVNLKGFRPGKVPKEILKRQFGKAVFSEVLDKVLKDTSTKALEENKIKPAGQPKLDLKTYGEDKDLEYVLSVTELPKVEVKSIENIKFDQPTNSIFFETKLLKTVINETDPELLELMKAEIHQMLSNYNNRTNDLFSKVRACIASSLASGNCNSVNIARQLNVSQRTLVRHLSSINTSLREIKADVIEELAKTALCKTHTSIYEIAIQMGFSETSSFDRMFKKKTGYTPIQFREKYVDIDYSSNRYF